MGSLHLTPRETIILTYIAAGKTTKAIAYDLGITETTVKHHLKRTFIKLGVESRAAAVAQGIVHKFIRPES